MFEQMKADGVISIRGLKDDAKLYGELVFDVNSAYFYNHGGYDFAKQFYADAYKAAVEIVGGEQYILSSVMHADERNRAMSEALGEDVYHYHLHVVYIPVVEKQILWSKRCKDKSLVGTVKETIMQVSSSKKWQSQPSLDENGNPMLTAKGKPILKKSYSVLQDDFFNAMRAAGYTDVERGERGSTEEHLTVTQFKVQAEQERLAELTQQAQQKAAEAKALDREIEKRTQKKIDIESIEKIEAKPVVLSSSRVSLAKSEYETLAAAAKKYYAQERRESKLQKALDAANKLIGELKAQITSLKQQISALLPNCRNTSPSVAKSAPQNWNRKMIACVPKFAATRQLSSATICGTSLIPTAVKSEIGTMPDNSRVELKKRVLSNGSVPNDAQSYGRSLSENQPTFTGVELINIHENQEVL